MEAGLFVATGMSQTLKPDSFALPHHTPCCCSGLEHRRDNQQTYIRSKILAQPAEGCIPLIVTARHTAKPGYVHPTYEPTCQDLLAKRFVDR